jgi:hypothetical protein
LRDLANLIIEEAKQISFDSATHGSEGAVLPAVVEDFGKRFRSLVDRLPEAPEP